MYVCMYVRMYVCVIAMASLITLLLSARRSEATTLMPVRKRSVYLCMCVYMYVWCGFSDLDLSQVLFAL